MDAGTNCCVEFCDLTDANFMCAPTQDDCIPFWVGGVPEGLGNLGFCAIP